jgi:hypothetical protein
LLVFVVARVGQLQRGIHSAAILYFTQMYRVSICWDLDPADALPFSSRLIELLLDFLLEPRLHSLVTPLRT